MFVIKLKMKLYDKIDFDKLYNITSLNISSDDIYLIATCSERMQKSNNFIAIYLVQDIIIKTQKEETPDNPLNLLQIPSMTNKSIKSEPAPNTYKKIECKESNTKFTKSCFTNNNKSILISREDGVLEMYDFINDKFIFSEKFHNNEILDFDVNDENGIVITS